MASLLLLATWLLRREGLGWPAVGLRRPPLWPTLIAIPAGLIATVAAVGLVKQLLSHTGVPAADYSVFRPLRGNLAEYLFWLLPVTVGSAAFGEEMIFRGMLLHEGRTLLGKGRLPTLLAILLQAAFFGVLHSYQGIGGIAITATVGLMLGLVWLFARRNLWPGIIIHTLFDASAMTAMYLGIPIS